jgi:hypothetical protein
VRRTLRVERVEESGAPAEVSEILSDEPPPDRLTTAAFVFAFERDQLLMVRSRGGEWELPGDVRGNGESTSAVISRATERAQVKLHDLRRFGWQRVRLLGPRPEGWEHGDDSYLALFVARIAATHTLVGRRLERQMFPPIAARDLPWVRENHLLYEAALLEATSPSV